MLSKFKNKLFYEICSGNHTPVTRFKIWKWSQEIGNEKRQKGVQQLQVAFLLFASYLEYQIFDQNEG